MIPYGRHWIDEEDIQAVVKVLRSDWLTTGPVVEEFESAVAEFVGGRYGVAVSSGTAALHAAMYAAGIQGGDEVILPPMTFVATANAVVFQGGKPVFADVDPRTLLINPAEVEKLITSRTKAIVSVDYAGQPCDYEALQRIARSHRLFLISDACHSLGGEYKGRKVGTLADLTVFSFHPVKHITTGEGGMVLTDNAKFAEKMRRFRNHGLTTDHKQRAKIGTWFYQMEDLGFNYRLSDFQCALGLSQLRKLPGWVRRRQEIAHHYNQALADLPAFQPLAVMAYVSHAYHLYIVQVDLGRVKRDRTSIFRKLRKEGIGVNIHYIPVHLQPFYRKAFSTQAGMCPVAEAAYDQILSFPIFSTMKDREVAEVTTKIGNILRRPEERCLKYAT